AGLRTACRDSAKCRRGKPRLFCACDTGAPHPAFFSRSLGIVWLDDSALQSSSQNHLITAGRLVLQPFRSGHPSPADLQWGRIMAGMAHHLSRAYSPVAIGPLTLRNRFIKSATNEGMSPGGVPSRQLVQFHAAMAAGGVGLTTVAYCAISADGCTLPNQICLDRDTLPHL